MPRPQFTLRALLVLLLAIACFFGGIRFERERQREKAEQMKLEVEQARRNLLAVKKAFMEERRRLVQNIMDSQQKEDVP
ncbi:MAG TPA: hypothetical protein VG125_09805 [Pirellulales bacterium]|jgi:Flp pilus assembly protein TadB|nr:hypothetical protein [Pirellulales bacterium]